MRALSVDSRYFAIIISSHFFRFLFYKYMVVFLFNIVIYVFLLKESMYSCILIVRLCILNVVHVFLSLSMYTYCCPRILRRGYAD